MKNNKKMPIDVWPEYTAKQKKALLKALKEATKAKIFDFDENKYCQKCR